MHSRDWNPRVQFLGRGYPNREPQEQHNSLTYTFPQHLQSVPAFVADLQLFLVTGQRRGVLVGNTLKQSLLVNLKLPNERLRDLEATGTVYSAIEQILQVRRTNAPFQIESGEVQDVAPDQNPSLWVNRNKRRLHLTDPVVMAPGYRNSNRRQTRTGYVDHDVFEGLPVRHWRRDFVTVAPPPPQENSTSQNDIWAIELPYGMPKDSHLLPQHSQDLLRAARSGRIYKRPLPAEEEEVEPEAILGDKPEKKDNDPKDKGFTAKTWKQVPRHLEGPDEEYLAKRRKGLMTLASKAAAGPTMMKTIVRREDAAGNVEVKEVIAPQGAQVQGEVIAQTVVGGAVDRFAHPTPPKRKGAPPKKKVKGPGRGRKKKAAPPTSVPAQIDGAAQSDEGAEGAVGPDGVKIEKIENEHGGAVSTTNEDTEMAEGSVAGGSMAASDDEGGEDGEEGDEGDEDEGSVSAQNSPSKPPRPFSPVASELPHMREPPNLGSPDAEMGGTDNLPGPPLPHLEMLDGSPLKNVAMTTSSVTSPVKSQSPLLDSTPPEQSIPETTDTLDTAEPTTLDKVMLQDVAETAPPTLPPPPPEPTIAEVISSTEVLKEEEEEEEMLLDTLENLNANIGAPQNPVISEPELSAEMIHQAEGLEIAVPDPQPSKAVEPLSEGTEVSAAIEPAEEVTEQHVEAGEPFTDLLGGLEKQVEEPQEQASPVAETQTEPEKLVEPAELITESVREENTEEVSVAPEAEEKTEEVSGGPEAEEKTEGVSGASEAEEKTERVSGAPAGEEKMEEACGDTEDA